MCRAIKVMKLLLTGWLMLALSVVASDQAMATQRPVVAVAAFTNEAGATADRWWTRGVGEQLRHVLSDELRATGSFVVVDRPRALTATTGDDRVASDFTAARGAEDADTPGHARYLIAAAVSAYGEGSSSSKAGVADSTAGRHVYVALDVRVIDTQTANVVHTRTVDSRRGCAGACADLARPIDRSGDLDRTPLPSKALRSATMEATDYLRCVMALRTQGCLARYSYREHHPTQGLLDLE